MFSGSLHGITAGFCPHHQARCREDSRPVGFHNRLVDGHGEAEIVSSDYDSLQTGLSLRTNVLLAMRRLRDETPIPGEYEACPAPDRGAFGEREKPRDKGRDVSENQQPETAQAFPVPQSPS